MLSTYVRVQGDVTLPTCNELHINILNIAKQPDKCELRVINKCHDMDALRLLRGREITCCSHSLICSTLVESHILNST